MIVSVLNEWCKGESVGVRDIEDIELFRLDLVILILRSTSIEYVLHQF
jgi:hypothetical protein